MARPPDWLIYAGVVAALAGVGLMRVHADAPPAPAVADEAELGGLLGPVTPFDPQVVVEAPDAPSSSTAGTAFAIAGDGLWLTARHVVEGCRRAALVVGGGRAVQADVRLARRSDIALLITEGGPDALPVSRGDGLRVGQRGYHPGFPQGRPGEAASRLIGRETLRVQGRGRRDEPVLAWAEIGRTEGLAGSLAGLSGAPALDGRGQVAGVTIAEAPRRGRIYTTAPETFGAVTRASVQDSEYAPGALVTADNYGVVADGLRRDLRVAQVVCLG